MAYYETQTTQAIGCTSCAGVGEYEAHVIGHTRPLRFRRVPFYGLGGPLAVSGIGEEPQGSPENSIAKSLGYAAVGAAGAWLLAELATKAFKAKQPKEIVRNSTLLGAAVGLFASM